MKAIKRIALTELQTMFYSPIAWFILIIFTFQASMTFVNAFEGYVVSQELGRYVYNVTMGTFTNPWRGGLFPEIQGYLYLYIPLLTMGIMSRELSSGSIKLLYSSPVTNFQIVIGKFISIMIYALVMIAVLGLFVIYGVCFVHEFDLPPVLAGLLGLYLLICAYGAIGLFMSSLTSYQVVAAMGTFAVFAVLNYVGGMWQDIAFVRDITYWLSIRGRSGEFINGLLCSEDVIYFLVVVVLFLTFTVIRLTVIRKKKSWFVSTSWYFSAILIAVSIGYLSSRPTFMCYYDATRTKVNTLTPNSQEIVSKMKGNLTITTYANVLDEDRFLWYGFPKSELSDIKRFKQYTRFKPDIKMKYVRYYAKGNNEKELNKRYPTLNDRERMVKITQNYGVDSSIYLDVNEVSKLEDLSGENYRFVRVLERENGQKAFLRIYDDMYVFPFETEITAAFKRLVMDLPQVGFVEGHGERDCIKQGDRDYNRFAQDKPFRYSLINQGFDFRQVTLDEEIPEDINILVIADVREVLPEAHRKNLDAYIARGGNLLIAGEPKRQKYMNPLVEQFGVRFMSGRLVSPSENFQSDFIMSKVTKEAAEFSYELKDMYRYGNVATMPSTVGLDLSGIPNSGFKVTVLLVTDSLKTVWNEVESTDFVDEIPVMNPDKGEVELNQVPTMVALSRAVGNREQKIIILGDADCLSNGEISISRNGVGASNYSLITSSFFWMSDGEVPIDVRRPKLPDNKVYVTKGGMTVTKIVLIGVIPLMLILFASVIWIRRRGR
ncbi:Gldg family protein [Butyricimonas virosa]|uniref:Gldg family protein n=1 Tax=Butyricimonas virosa TaxID=544645 RepID=UPI0039F5C9E4